MEIKITLNERNEVIVVHSVPDPLVAIGMLAKAHDMILHPPVHKPKGFLASLRNGK